MVVYIPISYYTVRRPPLTGQDRKPLTSTLAHEGNWQELAEQAKAMARRISEEFGNERTSDVVKARLMSSCVYVI